MTSPKPISVQLYSLRDAAEKDFLDVLQKMAAIGFTGVEPCGLYGMSPSEFRKVVDDLGLKVPSSHYPWVNPNNIAEVIDIAGHMGNKFVTCGYGGDEFKTLDSIKKTADITNSLVDKITAAGLQLVQHNHWWEYQMIDGRIAYDIYAELCPKVKFELDMYWAANHGLCNPAEQLAKIKHRTPLLHVKDGPLVKDKAMTAAGTGKVDIPAVIAQADDSVLQWLIIELDSCDTDMLQAVKDSYTYLVNHSLGLAR